MYHLFSMKRPEFGSFLFKAYFIQSLLLRELPQKVNPRSLALIGEGFLFGPQNSLFWNLLCCLHIRSRLVA
jgi:hypothetical protein